MLRKLDNAYIHNMKDNNFQHALNQLHWAVTNELIEQGDLEDTPPEQILMGAAFHIDQFVKRVYLSL